MNRQCIFKCFFLMMASVNAFAEIPIEIEDVEMRQSYSIRRCCRAYNAKCLACATGQTVEEYCEA
eukprot:CAMPEP_0119314206 /NCGR_PEP_ID=MMETSP1333-20130426/32072_1 /TAXON_ID=418940 /ORGANISM="Scyphosphaera apsteinii, Strain RCC1455" /LENGTH=64 /DNA_ID=CAMNT_0007319273 /DNA_START=84 /DNA_END=275 /DNA_ORIENTATION=+